MQTLKYSYSFALENKREKTFNVVLDKQTLLTAEEGNKKYPDWAKLDYYKCENCTLDLAVNEYCPAAKAIFEPAEYFKKTASYEKAKVTVTDERRKITAETTVQQGLSSLLGLCMAASGCPVLEKLRPLIRYHMPFVTSEETRFRILSMYLLGQYYGNKNGKKPDWEMLGLVNIYDNIRTVNHWFCKRLSHVGKEDAGVNAVTILDCFAIFVPGSVSDRNADAIGEYFRTYIK
jgi:hypothetical protein